MGSRTASLDWTGQKPGRNPQYVGEKGDVKRGVVVSCRLSNVVVGRQLNPSIVVGCWSLAKQLISLGKAVRIVLRFVVILCGGRGVLGA
jgi:hypothetical protein